MVGNDKLFPVYRHYRIPKVEGPGLPFWAAWRKGVLARIVDVDDILNWERDIALDLPVTITGDAERIKVFMKLSKAVSRATVTRRILEKWAGFLEVGGERMRLPVELYSREKSDWYPWPRGGMTECALKDGDVVIGRGMGWCSAHDQYSFWLGRIVAYGRALENAGSPRAVEHLLPLFGQKRLRAIMKEIQLIANVSGFKL